MSAAGEPRGDRDAAAASGELFRSRWVARPPGVRELGPDAGLPTGFRAAGVACGIKPSGRPDLGLLVCDAAAPASAARFTASSAAAAPVILTRERCRLGALRAVLANSGCANAATGQRGLDDATLAQQAAAEAVGLRATEVAVASTGGISDFLPMDRVLGGVRAAVTSLNSHGDVAFQQAIQTTDALEKRASLAVELGDGTVRLSAQCKGAGMISPRFATMLCFVECDAGVGTQAVGALLDRALAQSFDCISVDGQMSTNDTVILICSRASGVDAAPGSAEEQALGDALAALLRQLAVMIVADGEGAGRIARVLVRGPDAEPAELAARAVANSPLVKTALHGADPNWGRIAQAVGGALPGPAPLAVDIAIEGVRVCAGGAAIEFDQAALAGAIARSEVEYEITLPGAERGAAEAEVLFSDLSHDYVTVNADYTS